MLFHVTFKAKAGYTEDDAKRVLELWSKWQPPEGMEIKAFCVAAGGGGYIITEAQSAEILFEAFAPWASVLLNYDIVPVVDVEKAAELGQKAIAFRES